MPSPPSEFGGSWLVFSDDWGRHPSSCQHLFRRLAAQRPAWWVNTIGTRRPEINLATVKRGWEKFREWRGSRPHSNEKATCEQVAQETAGSRLSGMAPQVHVVSPFMWPWFQSATDRRLNRRLLLRRLKPVVAAMPQPVIAVTTIPIVADLVGSLAVDRWVYYCVDDFSVWPGLDQATMRRMEADLIERVDVVIAVSEVLRENLQAGGRESSLLTHGVDEEFWRGASGSPIASVSALPRPLALFWGVIDRRMDIEFLRALGDRMKGGAILLVGPQNDPDPALFDLPNIAISPPQPFAALPGLAKEAAALIMPYDDLPVTRAMQPLKLKEYLATGQPVIVRDLPSTRPWADCLDMAASSDEFAALVMRRLDEGPSPSQTAARERLAKEGWAAKAEQFAQFALAELPNHQTKQSYIS